MSKPVASVLRSLDVLGCFRSSERPMTVAEVATQSGLTRGTTHRLLHTLVSSGYLVTRFGQYQLTPHVLKLGEGYLRTDPLASISQLNLEFLTRETGLHTAVGVLDGDHVVCVAAASVPGPLAVSTTIGSRLPAVSTSLGRVLLADSPVGAVSVDGEFDPQLRTVGVPIAAAAGRVVASLAVVTGDPAVSMRQMETTIVELAHQAANQIGAQLAEFGL